MSDSTGELSVVNRSVESLQVLQGFKEGDKEERHEAFIAISNLFLSWFMGFGSPREEAFLENSGNGAIGSGDTSMLHLIDQQLPAILRLSLTAPVADVRENCQKLLDECKAKGLKIPRAKYPSPSRFIPKSQVSYCVDMETNGDDAEQNDRLSRCLREHFHNWNRVDNSLMVMGLHPEYLESFLKVHDRLFAGESSPLPDPDRHYIALMAASRHHCLTLVNLHAECFLISGGEVRWLFSINEAPLKYRELSVANRLLAHQPWLLGVHHVEALKQHFSLSELMHALAILTHVHSLCGFFFGCGVSPETDQPDAYVFRNPSNNQTGSSLSESAGMATPITNGGSEPEPAMSDMSTQLPVKELMTRMEQLRSREEEDVEEEELTKRFIKVETQNAELPTSLGPSKPADEQMVSVMNRFVDEPDFAYDSFYHRDKQHTTLKIQDFSWEDEGCCLANRLWSEFGSLLDDRINVAYQLTYNTMGDLEDVDTSSFRCAVWNYVHSLYGVRHDDYNYNQVNQLLDRPLKSYIKTVACNPSRVTKKDYDSCMKDFRHSEKVHVNVMILEARMQAALLYTLRAITRLRT